MEYPSSKAKPKAVVAGGSIAGVSCAHALLAAGWDVVLLEKTSSPPTGIITGAGVGIDPLTQTIIGSWLPFPHLLHHITLPLTIDHNQATIGERKIIKTLARDEHFNFKATHWSDLYNMLYRALPSDTVLWGHYVLSFSVSDDNSHVNVKCKVLKTGDIVELAGDLLVAADGVNSAIRNHFLPHLKLRYAGYTAWRGVLDFSNNEHLENAVIELKKLYPDLGKCLYFDLSSKDHSVLYELPNKRLNWIWYNNRPEPALEGYSVTMKVSRDVMENMQEAAKEVWVPEFARIMGETKEPFLNVMYDCDPIEHIVWGNVVLVGDAAHPTTPHCLRSTNMSVLDAAVLGKCLEKWGATNLSSALAEYQSIRLPVVSKQVLHSRRVGRIKQGLNFSDRKPLDLSTAIPEDCEELQQKKMPFFADVPSILL